MLRIRHRVFEEASSGITRLFPDYRSVWKKNILTSTGIYPIMHTIAIRRDVYEENPWIARNLMNAFEEARDRSVERITSVTASRIPVPWGYEYAGRMGSRIFDGNGLWPYGIEANRTTIEAFLQYCFEQGVCPPIADARTAVRSGSPQ